MAETIKVIALARVSTELQKKLSLTLQLARIRSWASAMGYEVIREFSEVMSGRKENRVGVQTAIDLACQEKAIIVTYDSTRLFRNMKHMLNAFDKLDAHGAAYASVTEPMMDTRNGSASANLVRTIFGAIGQFFSEQSGEKIAMQNKATVKERKSEQWPEGHRTNGSQPIGWKLDENGHRVPCEEERASIAAAKQAMIEVGKKEGRCTRAAKLLNERGVLTISEIRARRNGRENRRCPEWTVNAVRFATMTEKERAKWLKVKRQYRKRKMKGMPV